MAQKIDFVSLLHKSQEYISENYAAALSDLSKVVQLRSYIEKYLHDSGFEVEGMTFRELSDKLYSEMRLCNGNRYLPIHRKKLSPP